MEAYIEQELIRGLLNKNEQSFNLLFNQYSQKIYNIAYRMVGNHKDAEDITQEVFISIYKHIDQFREESKLYTWIYTITKNICFQHLNRQKKGSFNSLETLIFSEQDKDIPQLSELEKQNLVTQVKDGCFSGLLRCLSFNQRLAFILNVLIKLSINDVAMILDKSEPATRVLIHRARKNLKHFLCKNCSLYAPNNPCQCENLINFSLANNWIQFPTSQSISRDLIPPQIIEKEVSGLRKVTRLYQSLQTKSLSNGFTQQLQEFIHNQDWIIFTKQKV